MRNKCIQHGIIVHYLWYNINSCATAYIISNLIVDGKFAYSKTRRYNELH